MEIIGKAILGAASGAFFGTLAGGPMGGLALAVFGAIFIPIICQD